MKNNTLILMLILIGFAVDSFHHAHADQKLPRQEVKDLVWGAPPLGRQEQWNAWVDKLRTRPDIKPDLFAMIQETKDWEELGQALFALRQRTDLTSDELAIIVDRLEGYLHNAHPKDLIAKSFMMSGLPILRNHPSEKHEQMALDFLKFPDNSVKESAVYTLEAIGTEKSLPALRSYVEEKKPAPGNASRYYDEGLATLKTVERKVKEASRERGGYANEGKSGVKKGKNDVGPPENEIAGKRFWLCLTAVIALLTAISLSLKCKLRS